MMSLHYFPTILMVSILTLVIRIYISPPDHMNLALTSSGFNPTFLPMIYIFILSSLVISVILIIYHLFFCVLRSVACGRRLCAVKGVLHSA